MNLKKMQSNLFSQKTFENSDVLVFLSLLTLLVYIVSTVTHPF